jgi:hypothetical protein
VCKALAKRFQGGIAFQFITNCLAEKYEAGPSEEVFVGDFAIAVGDAICKETKVCRSDTVYLLGWVKIGHYVFKPTAVAVNSVRDDVPQFGVVTDVIAIDRQIYLVQALLETIHYDEHFHAYAVKHPFKQHHVCITIDSLKDHIPLQYHVIHYEGELTMLVSLRYALF